MASRLEHQACANPVIFGKEMRPPLHHGRPLQARPASGHQAHRIAACMPIDTSEGVAGHEGSTSSVMKLEALRAEWRKIYCGACAAYKVANKPPGSCRLRQAQMTMPESVEHSWRRPCAADDRERIRQRRPETHPLPTALRFQAGEKLFRLFQHGARAGIVWRPVQPGEFHRPADAQPGDKRADDKAMTNECKVPSEIESTGGQRCIVAALRFQRNAVPKTCGVDV